MHIGIAGNIGCGKTTLTRMLASHYGWIPKYESVTYNPYLEDYYKDIPRWSFNLEVYFLEQRFRDVLEISRSKDVIIQDRTLLEGVYIFVANNYAMGNLSEPTWSPRSRSAAATTSSPSASTTSLALTNATKNSSAKTTRAAC